MASLQPHAEYVQQLQSPNPVDVYMALRTIKNAIIGSSTKKSLYFRLHIIPHVSALLAMDDTDVQIRIQATTIVSSLAHKGEDAAKELLEGGVMVSLISQIMPGTDALLMEASERALNALLSYTGTKMSAEEHTYSLVPYLLSIVTKAKDSAQIFEMRTHARIELAVLILGKLCVTESRQFTVANAGAIELLVPLLLRGYPRLQIATLRTISALSYENMEICRALAAVPHDGRALPAILLELAQHQDPEIRLQACVCISNLSRMRASGGAARDIQSIAVPALAKLLRCPDVGVLQVVQALGYLCHEDAEMQIAAKNAGVIADIIHIIAETESRDGADFVDSEHNIQVAKAGFLALGTIVSAGEECRTKAVENQMLAYLVRAMDHRDDGIKAAACLCTQYIVRSVPICRTHVSESGILKPLLRLVRHDTPEVQMTATAALINLLPDFSPLRAEALKENVVDILVELLDSKITMVRRNALWCIRNLLVNIDDGTRRTIIDKVGIGRICAISHPDSEPVIREQAAGVLQNITAENDQGTLAIFDCLGAGQTVDMLTGLLDPQTDTPTQVHGLYLVNNIAVRSQAYCEYIAKHRALLQAIVALVTSPISEVAVGALWCVNSIASHKMPTARGSNSNSGGSGGEDGEPRYLAELEELGVQAILEGMLGDASLCLSVRDRVKSCLDYYAPLAI
ncbi:hypothetical protein LPJ61_001892 [Coemansia biformis]|uniref:Armadillo repeat-containing protein 8 n=1 Tax=Coemansia biformis TaxID=1286918 RepID=A0A9W8CZN5_9FUNG|nr:hypothetical protein LPJ61_001892 [Coemansia biformis]